MLLRYDDVLAKLNFFSGSLGVAPTQSTNDRAVDAFAVCTDSSLCRQASCTSKKVHPIHEPGVLQHHPLVLGCGFWRPTCRL
jgi:hypothetical protein